MSRITRIGLSDHWAIARAYSGQEAAELDEQQPHAPVAKPEIQAPPSKMRGDRPAELSMLPTHLANDGNIPQNLTTGRIAGFMEQQRAPVTRAPGRPPRAGSGVGASVTSIGKPNKQNKRDKAGAAIGQAGKIDKTRAGANGRKATAKR